MISLFVFFLFFLVFLFLHKISQAKVEKKKRGEERGREEKIK
jgi:hypothetical protein